METPIALNLWGMGDLREAFSVFPMDAWRYQPLQHFPTAHLRGDSAAESLTNFESLWYKQPTDRGLLSTSYKLLNKHNVSTGLRFFREWEIELESHCTEPQKRNMLRLVYTSSICIKIQEANYKFLSRWYRVSKMLAISYPLTSDRCWWGCGLQGSHIHIWWECPKIRSFWVELRALISEITTVPIQDDPVQCLLHGTQSSIRAYKKSTVPHLKQQSAHYRTLGETG